ncbi:uncharacterized protein LOC128740122 [Sabethes cyaneus]|uniref:uncharacterized protein LOC128740122 n=1 Tax=Sabethes cyaneus TaxID=53552 RepID=UPI00237E166A|nr:uncharacterized protein LOC128740122 [Sabethes cyaneus]
MCVFHSELEPNEERVDEGDKMLYAAATGNPRRAVSSETPNDCVTGDASVDCANVRDRCCATNQAPMLLYYQNTRGLRSKVAEFSIAASASLYDCIVLTESWLDPQICSSQLFGSEYNVFRTDRCLANSNKSSGGGVVVAVRSSFQSALIIDAMDDSLEQLWVQIIAENSIVVIGVIYVPPNLRNEHDVFERHILSIEKATVSIGPCDDLLLFGDYNGASLSWSKQPGSNYLVVDALHSTINVSSSCLLEGVALSGLYQINEVHNQNNRLLDLIFVNQHTLPACDVCPAPEILSIIDVHHPPVMVSFYRNFQQTFIDEFDPSEFDFRRGDFDSMNAYLMTIYWISICNCTDFNKAVDKFTATIHQAIADHVPKVRPRRKPACGTTELSRLNRKRKSALRAYHKNRNSFNRIRFTTTSRRYKILNKQLYQSYVQNTERNLRLNPKSFWKFVNSKRKEHGLPSSVFLKNDEASTVNRKCDLFAEYFSGVFSLESASSENIEAALRFVTSDEIAAQTFTVTEVEVAEAVGRMKQC